jgi:hypothetical protein
MIFFCLHFPEGININIIDHPAFFSPKGININIIDHPVFISPKGNNTLAQGIALGTQSYTPFKP